MVLLSTFLSFGGGSVVLSFFSFFFAAGFPFFFAAVGFFCFGGGGIFFFLVAVSVDVSSLLRFVLDFFAVDGGGLGGLVAGSLVLPIVS